MAQRIQLQPPETFNFRTPDDWPRWLQRFDQFRVASGLADAAQAQQVSTLLYCLGEEAESVLASTNITAEQRRNYDDVITRFQDFFKVRRNVIFERARFNRCAQQDGETAEQYIMELYRLADTCNYGDLRDEMIRDRLVVGIRDTTLSAQLQLDAELTLEKAKTKIRQREAVGQQQAELKSGPRRQQNTPMEAVHPGKTHGRRMQRQPQIQQRIQQREAKPCRRCGRSSHPRDKCPAKDAVCHRCNKKGHFRSQCLSKQVATIEPPASSSQPTAAEDIEYLSTVTAKTSKTAWYTVISVNGRELHFKIDTGAAVSAISKEDYVQIGSPKLCRATRKLCGPSEQPLATLGQFTGILQCKGISVKQRVYVIEGLKSNLLGLPAITSLGLAVRVDTIEDTTTSIRREYPTVFTGLGNLGEAYKIRLKEGATPFSLFTPRHIPIPLRPKVKAELERMEGMGVIRKVEEPTPWCAAMVVAPKKEGAIRICVDLKPLNDNVLREVHPLPRVDDILAQLTGAKVFSKLDANSGFWQIPLAEESQLLTTFITPFGRYCFNKLPFGISSAPEHFQKRMSRILSGLEGVVCLMDDVLVFGSTQEQHKQRLNEVLHRVKEAGVTLNPNKCEFAKSELKFLGHLIDQEGIRADPEKTTAITEFATPTTVPQLRRFMGMVNQLGKFSPRLADLTQPLRQLLSKKSAWAWGPAQSKAFSDIKEELTKPTILALYDAQAPTKVCADASSYGLGAVIMQEISSIWRPIAYASRSMTETEKRYAQIEKEALAATWACEKFATYILGMKFHIETDHKPLVPLLGSKHLDSLPPRILRFRLRLSRFSYDISHVPGKLLYTADALSRAPSPSSVNDVRLQEEAEALMELSVATLPAGEERRNEYREAQSKDSTCAKVIELCRQGWSDEKQNHHPDVRPYWKARGDLTIDKDGLLLHGKRMVVPRALRRRTLEKIHTGHQGIQRCLERAKTSVWWPGILKEVENTVRECRTCAREAVEKTAPMIACELPDYPWQKIGTDLFQLKGVTYLLVVDYFSRYPEIYKLRTTNSSEVIKLMKTTFSRFGIPEVVFSDNGPQYVSQEFKDFGRSYGFQHVTSSPHYPQSNGQAERTVKTIKQLLSSAEDQDLALLIYRSTPFPWCGLSPAELLMGRRLRSNIPLQNSQLTPAWDYLGKFKENNKRFKDQQKRDFDRRHRVKNLPDLSLDQDVWVKTGQPEQAKVIRPAGTPRSYIVQTNTGQELRRNRQHLTVQPGEDLNQLPTSRKDEQSVREPIQTRSKTGTKITPPERW